MHWYAPDGAPMYEVKAANGNMRPTTLADARKLQLVPSVTTILSILGKPGLDFWKQGQLLQAVMDTPFSRGTRETWRREIIKKSQEHSKNASERGSELHDKLEQYYLTGSIDKKDEAFIRPVVEALNAKFGNIEWIPEKSFSHKLGFGGKVDMHSKEGIVLDFKTKGTSDLKKMVPYDDHHMQTAAYAVGLEMPGADRYNLFISTEEPGLLNLTQSMDFGREWSMFDHLRVFWQLSNKYSPKWDD